VYIFDGAAPRSLGNHIQDYLRRRIDAQYIERSYVFFDNQEEHLWVFFPARGGSGKINSAVIIDMSRQGFPLWPMSWDNATFDLTAGIAGFTESDVTLGDLAGFTLGEMAGTQLGDFVSVTRNIVLGDAGGIVWTTQENQPDAGQPIKAWFETGVTDLGAADKLKTLIELQHMITSLSSDTCRVRVRYSEHGAIDRLLDDATKSFTANGKGPYTTEHRLTGREFGKRFEVDATDTNFHSGAIGAFRVRGAR
jgi:hypothetical protein